MKTNYEGTSKRNIVLSIVVLVMFSYSYFSNHSILSSDTSKAFEETSKEAEHTILKLGERVQARLHRLQNPPSCSKARKLVCDLGDGRGFGQHLHHVMFCLLYADLVNRTLILDSSRWVYTSKGWESVFLPLSDSCTAVGDDPVSPWRRNTDLLTSKLKVIHMPIITHYHRSKHFRWLSVPPDILHLLESASHKDPQRWWIGQMANYVFRLSPNMRGFVEEHIKSLGFRSPVVGVHVRRTDKIKEASYQPLTKYMKHVSEFYVRFTDHERTSINGANITNNGATNIVTSNSATNITSSSATNITSRKGETNITSAGRRVFLATDDPSIISEARQQWPNFTFIGDFAISRSAGKSSRDPVRHGDDALRGVITDLYMLSRSDFLVCTFSSNLGRVAYELMLALRPDAPDRVMSLDAWSFWDLRIRQFRGKRTKKG